MEKINKNLIKKDNDILENKISYFLLQKEKYQNKILNKLDDDIIKEGIWEFEREKYIKNILIDIKLKDISEITDIDHFILKEFNTLEEDNNFVKYLDNYLRLNFIKKLYYKLIWVKKENIDLLYVLEKFLYSQIQKKQEPYEQIDTLNRYRHLLKIKNG